MEVLDLGYTYIILCSYLVGPQKSLTLFDCKTEMYFTFICMVVHSNLETDYDPDYLDS